MILSDHSLKNHDKTNKIDLKWNSKKWDFKNPDNSDLDYKLVDTGPWGFVSGGWGGGGSMSPHPIGFSKSRLSTLVLFELQEQALPL